MAKRTAVPKQVITIALAAVAWIAGCSADGADQQASADCGAYAGVWRYDVEGKEGLMIVSGNHAIGLMTALDRPALGDSPSEAELAHAFTTAEAWAARIRCEGDRVYNEGLYNLNPAIVGQVTISESEVVNNQIHWWALAEDGSRGNARLTATLVQ